MENKPPIKQKVVGTDQKSEQLKVVKEEAKVEKKAVTAIKQFTRTQPDAWTNHMIDIWKKTYYDRISAESTAAEIKAAREHADDAVEHFRKTFSKPKDDKK